MELGISLLFGLQYFVQVYGKTVIAVAPVYTSQDCWACGNTVKKSLSVRTHICGCGAVLDRDHIAVLNKMRYTPLATDALCPMPYALCPMPYTLCPMPARAPHVTEKRYNAAINILAKGLRQAGITLNSNTVGHTEINAWGQNDLRPLLVGGDINGQVDWLNQESPCVHAPGVSNESPVFAQRF